MSEDIAAELLFCEFRSNLTRTTSHDWHVQPFVKDPRESALGGRFRIVTASNLAVLAVVLETFQTYYAFSRAVNPSTSIVTGEHRDQTRNMPLQLALSPEVQRTKAPERSNSLKILFWRFRDSANPPENFVPDIQPRGRGSSTEANSFLADFIFIADRTKGCKSQQLNLYRNFGAKLAKPHKH
jgi:hypothetical protein